MKTIILCMMIIVITCWADDLTVRNDPENSTYSIKPGKTATFAALTYPISQTVTSASDSFNNHHKLRYDNNQGHDKFTLSAGSFTVSYDKITNISLQPNEINLEGDILLSARSAAYNWGYAPSRYKFEESL